jgi:hypothetical protein
VKKIDDTETEENDENELGGPDSSNNDTPVTIHEDKQFAFVRIII